MLKKNIAILLSLMFLTLPVAGQQQQPQQQQQPASPAAHAQEETVRVGSTAVQVDVIVTDKTGRHITGLSADDFQLLDEGKPQALDFFASIEGSRLIGSENRGASASAASATKMNSTVATTVLARPYPGRHLAFVIDDTSMMNENFIRTRSALTQYINKLTPNDMAAVISTGGRLGSLQQFTNDKQRLLNAINRVAAQSNRSQVQSELRFSLTAAEAVRINAGDKDVLQAVARRASAQSIANQSTTGTLADGAISRGSNSGDSSDLKGDDTKDPLTAQIRTIAQGRVGEIAAEARNTIKTLTNLFKAMGELPGRKIVVLLSESFITLGGTSEDQTIQLQQLIDLGRRSGVSVYALDSAGLRTNSAQANEHLTGVSIRAQELAVNSTFSDYEKLGAARYIATGTGGSLISNTNDLVAGLDRAVEDASSYYVIGFRPLALDNKFHRLSVSIKGKPDLVVRTRKGYLAVNQETVAGTNTELAAALISPLPLLDLPVEVVANVVPQGAGQSVLVGFHVGRNYLTLPAATAADQSASYEILAYVFAVGKEQPVGGVRRTVTLDLSKPEERQKLTTAGLIYVPQPFTLEPGMYQIRAVMREKSSGAVGSNYQFFDVPDLANHKLVSMSSILLNDAGKTEFGGANSFKRGGEMDVHYIAYNLPKDAGDLTQRVRLLDGQGKVLLDSPLPLSVTGSTAGSNMIPQGTRLKVPMARGRYALVINVQDKKGKVDLERRADFVVE